MRAYLKERNEYIYPEKGFEGASVFYGLLEGYSRKGVYCFIQKATGVKDNSGVEIYEGDEVEVVYRKGVVKVGIVVYDSGCFLIYNEETDFVEYLGVRKLKSCKLKIV